MVGEEKLSDVFTVPIGKAAKVTRLIPHENKNPKKELRSEGDQATTTEDRIEQKETLAASTREIPGKVPQRVSYWVFNDAQLRFGRGCRDGIEYAVQEDKK